MVDYLKFGLDRFHPHELSKFRLERTDIRDRDAIRALVNDFFPDVIIHLGAIHYIPQCEKETCRSDINKYKRYRVSSFCISV